MNEFALLLESQENASLQDALGEMIGDEQVALKVCNTLAEAKTVLEKETQNDNALLLAMLDASLPEPVGCARTLTPLAPLAHWCFVGLDEGSPLRCQINSPFSRLGSHCSVVNAPAAREIRQWLASSRQRYRHQAQLAEINRQLHSPVKDSAQELRRYTLSADFLTHLFETSNEAVIATTPDGNIVRWNPAASRLFGLNYDYAFKHNIQDIAADQWHEDMPAILKQIVSSPEQQMEIELRCRLHTGSLRDVELKLSQIRDGQGNMLGLSMFVSDISTRTRAQAALDEMNRRLEMLSYQDDLTGIANRRRFDLAIEQSWREARRQQSPVSLAIIDIDYFKHYNDSLGHLAGDACLRKVATALSQTIRRSSDLLARYGGEEFVILLPQTGNPGAKALLTQCQEKIKEENIRHPDSSVDARITFSCGIATMIPETDDPTTLIRMADKQLYRAKLSGRNKICSTTQC